MTTFTIVETIFQMNGHMAHNFGSMLKTLRAIQAMKQAALEDMALHVHG